MRTAVHSKPAVVKKQQHRRELTLGIFAFLLSNGRNARPVFDMRGKVIPEGSMRELIKRYPYDAVRCELAGCTLTVEVTNERHGEQDDPDALRFACYDLNDFLNWFVAVLQREGMQMQPSADVPADLANMFMGYGTSRPTSPIRPDLRPPIFHHKRKGRR